MKYHCSIGRKQSTSAITQAGRLGCAGASACIVHDTKKYTVPRCKQVLNATTKCAISAKTVHLKCANLVPVQKRAAKSFSLGARAIKLVLVRCILRARCIGVS